MRHLLEDPLGGSKCHDDQLRHGKYISPYFYVANNRSGPVLRLIRT